MITISNATQLSYKSSFEFFGSSIAFKKMEEIGLSCSFSDITKANGEALDVSAIEALKNSPDYSSWSINGRTFNKCKMTSFSVAESDYNTNVKVVIGLSIAKVADDLSALGGYYSDYGSAFSDSCAIVDSISESISLSRGENAISYSKEVSIKFSNSLQFVGKDYPAVEQARTFARAIFEYDAANGYSATIPSLGSEPQIDDLLNKDFRRIRSEKLDLINNECSFSESISAENIVDQTYSHACTRSWTKDESGVITVTENGRIMGLIRPIAASAETAYQLELIASKARIQEIFDYYNKCNTDLNTRNSSIMFLSISKKVDQFNGSIDYSLTANDDPKLANSSSNVRYELTTTFGFDSDSNSVTYNGVIEGLSNVRINSLLSGAARYVKYMQARTFFESILGDIPKTGLSPRATNRSETHSFLKGEITFERTFSDSPRFAKNDSTNLIKNMALSESYDVSRRKSNEFIIVNDGVLKQDTQGFHLNERTVSADLLLYRLPTTASGRVYLDGLISKAKAEILDLVEVGEKLKSANCEISIFNNPRIRLTNQFNTGLSEE